jgi:RimJ/RimL family protein N-acetyltransferase
LKPFAERLVRKYGAMNGPGIVVTLRPIELPDLDIFFHQQLDREANAMAGFTAVDPSDRAAFDGRWQRTVGDTTTTNRTILVGGDVAGHIAVYQSDDLEGPEVTYWLGRRWWGQQIATQALEQLLAEVRTRPVYGRCAETNPSSRWVLEKCGFIVVGQDEAFANALGKTVREYILRLDT